MTECGRCGLVVDASGEADPRCLCEAPLLLLELDASAVAEPLELNWGDRQPRPQVAAPPSEPAAAQEPAADPAPPASPSGSPADSDFAHSIARALALVITLAAVQEVVAALMAVVGLFMVWVKADSGYDYAPAGARIAAWLLLPLGLTIWAYLVLRAREQRGGAVASDELHHLLLAPLSPVEGSAAFRRFFADPKAALPIVSLQAAALLLAGAWVLAQQGFHFKPSGFAGMTCQIVVALVMARALLSTRALVLQVQQEEYLAAFDPGPLAPEPPAPKAPVAPPARVASAPPAAARVPAPQGVPRASAPPQVAPPPVVAAPAPLVEMCLHCGAAIDEKGGDCPECKAPQLFDVLLLGAVPDPRRIHAAALELGKLGPPAPSFAQAKQLLSSQGRRFVVSAHRAVAFTIVALLKKHEIAARVERVKRDRPKLLGASPATLAAVGGLSLAVVAVLLLLNRWPLGALSTEEVATLAKPAMATITCAEWSGSGFFIAPEVLVTNEHVACKPEEVPEVTLTSGKKLKGRVRGTDDWLDLALLEVPGAAAAPLKLGDASKLKEGSHVVMVGSPAGLDFSVHQAMVSHLARADMGIAYLQFDGNVNHGNSGGPLLDERGRVVGVVTARFDELQGVGLAVPVNYLGETTLLFSGEGPAPAQSPAWTRMKEIAERADEKEVKEIAEKYRKPTVVQMNVLGSNRLGVLLLQHTNTGEPAVLSLSVRVSDGSGRTCEDSIRSAAWEKLRPPSSRGMQRLHWMARHKLLDDFFSTLAVGPLLCLGQLRDVAKISVWFEDRELGHLRFGGD